MSQVSKAAHLENLARVATSVRNSVVQAALQRFRSRVTEYPLQRLREEAQRASVRASRHERELLEATASLDASACQSALAALLETKAELTALLDEANKRSSFRPQ
jgi:hypothetical protein